MAYNLRKKITKPKRHYFDDSDSDSDSDSSKRAYFNRNVEKIELEYGTRTPKNDSDKLADEIIRGRTPIPKIILKRVDGDNAMQGNMKIKRSSSTAKMSFIFVAFLLFISFYWIHGNKLLGNIFKLDINYELIVMPVKNLNKVNSDSNIQLNLKSEKQEMKRTLFIEQECKNIEVNDFNYDYASKSNGARILSTFDTEPYGEGVVNFKFLGFNLGPIPNILFPENVYNLKGPSSLLEDSGKIGDCWAFRRTWGRARIQLSRPVYIKRIILEHHPMIFGIDENIAAKSAPRFFSLTGIDFLENGQEIHSHLGTFEFEKNGRHVQVFHVTSSEANYPFSIIELHVTANHGNKEFTCVYRLRVYGRE